MNLTDDNNQMKHCGVAIALYNLLSRSVWNSWWNGRWASSPINIKGKLSTSTYDFSDQGECQMTYDGMSGGGSPALAGWSGVGLDLGEGPGLPGTGGAALEGASTPAEPCLPGGPPPPGGTGGGADLMDPGRLRVGDGDGGLRYNNPEYNVSYFIHHFFTFASSLKFDKTSC